MKADALKDIPTTSFENALNGKVAGLQLTNNSGQAGSAPAIRIRGIGSMNAGNEPLYVVDGVPVSSGNTGQMSGELYSTNNIMNTLNPEDIESISVLKDAAASSLYGSRAANGVILITTKKGKAGMQRIVFNSNLTVDHAICLPEFQDRYGASGATSWGTEDKNLKAYNNVDDYFSNGVTATNSLSIMTGKEKMQTYFSYANTTAKGIVDVNMLQKDNITFR